MTLSFQPSFPFLVHLVGFAELALAVALLKHDLIVLHDRDGHAGAVPGVHHLLGVRIDFLDLVVERLRLAESEERSDEEDEENKSDSVHIHYY
jgi:hypothetical protein